MTLGIYKHGFREISTSLYALQYSPNPIGVGAVNRQWVEKNPESAERFFRVIDKAILFIRQKPSEARDILAKATSIDGDVANKMNIMPMSLSTEIDLPNLDGYLAILYQMGEINNKPEAYDICINLGK